MIDIHDTNDIPEDIRLKIISLPNEEMIKLVKIDITTFQPVVCIDDYRIFCPLTKEGE